MHRIEQLTHKSSTYMRAEKSRRDFVISGPILVKMLVDDEEVSITFSVWICSTCEIEIWMNL